MGVPTSVLRSSAAGASLFARPVLPRHTSLISYSSTSPDACTPVSASFAATADASPWTSVARRPRILTQTSSPVLVAPAFIGTAMCSSRFGGRPSVFRLRNMSRGELGQLLPVLLPHSLVALPPSVRTSSRALQNPLAKSLFDGSTASQGFILPFHIGSSGQEE